MFQKLFQNKYSLVMLAVYVVALYVLLNKAIVPFVFKVLDSSVFTGDPQQSGQMTEVHDSRTAMALLQCNQFVKEEFGDDAMLTFSDRDYDSWDIGYGRFIIKSHVDVRPHPGDPVVRKNYVCQIKHEDGDMADINNWELGGLTLNDVQVSQ